MSFQILQSEPVAANRRTLIYLINTDGITPSTGLTFSGSDIVISKNGGVEANFAGSMTEVGHGLYTYQLTAAELNTLGYLYIRVLKIGILQFVKEVQVVGFEPYGPPPTSAGG